MNTTTIYTETIQLLNDWSIRHESYHFSSNIKMVDVWFDDHFYVLHFEDDFIGFSEIGDAAIGFDNVPDEKYFEAQKFKDRLSIALTAS